MSNSNNIQDNLTGAIVSVGVLITLAISFQIFLLIGVLLSYPVLLLLMMLIKGRKLDNYEKDKIKVTIIMVITLCIMAYSVFYIFFN